jgi:hypothetical protein
MRTLPEHRAYPRSSHHAAHSLQPDSVPGCQRINLAGGHLGQVGWVGSGPHVGARVDGRALHAPSGCDRDGVERVQSLPYGAMPVVKAARNHTFLAVWPSSGMARVLRMRVLARLPHCHVSIYRDIWLCAGVVHRTSASTLLNMAPWQGCLPDRPDDHTSKRLWPGVVQLSLNVTEWHKPAKRDLEPRFPR